MELLFHLFFIICHPYIPLHFVDMIFILVYSGVGTAGAPCAGAPVKFEVEGHPCGRRKLRCVAKQSTLASEPRPSPSPFTRALPVFTVSAIRIPRE